MATITKGKAIRADLDNFDGTLATSRTSSSGGTTTGLKIGNHIDVLSVFGSGDPNNMTDNTITKAINALGAANIGLEFAPGTWAISNNVTIPSNLTVIAPAGCIFSPASGKTLTIAGIFFREHTTYSSGAGTVTISGQDALAQDLQSYGQYVFPGTQNASSNVNTLDDYEEGTWTPVISDGTNDATTDAQEGDYTKIGNKVFISGKIAISSLGSVSGAIRITGLPFPSSGTTQGCAGGITVVNSSGLAITAGHSVTGTVGNAISYIILNLWDATTGTTAMQGSELSADGRLDFFGHYQAAT